MCWHLLVLVRNLAAAFCTSWRRTRVDLLTPSECAFEKSSLDVMEACSTDSRCFPHKIGLNLARRCNWKKIDFTTALTWASILRKESISTPRFVAVVLRCSEDQTWETLSLKTPKRFYWNKKSHNLLFTHIKLSLITLLCSLMLCWYRIALVVRVRISWFIESNFHLILTSTLKTYMSQYVQLLFLMNSNRFQRSSKKILWDQNV